ncbi:MAG: diadenylate cyclase CdaA [Candidatus Eiseniibacteriota bacterium]|nr:MAG: diadenylate cyclase CdaA [Candidatus Eisenbacteria bacterium]
MGLLSERWYLDLIDVGIVAFLFYKLFMFVRGTRAAQMFAGLLLLVVASLIAQWFQLHALNWIMASLKTVWVVAFVIIFQPELRRALALIGQNRVFGPFIRVEDFGVLGEILKAVEMMSEQKMGSLIAIERDANLRHYEETGTRLNARITSELLVTLFTPYSPLHDGAVIVRGDEAVAAGCILPLSQNPNLPQDLGTRHLAAVGLSEETDAVIIVVSEETGAISIASYGKLKRRLDKGTLRSELSTLLVRKPAEQAKSGAVLASRG